MFLKRDAQASLFLVKKRQTKRRTNVYNEHLYCPEYKGFKDTIANIINGDDTTTNVEKLAEHIQEVYDDGRMPSTQYDDLMSYIQDILGY